MKPSTEAQSAAPAPSITVGRHRLSQLPVELSIIVPTRNEFGNVRPLVELIRSALTNVPAEVVFVDDSDDRTPEAVMDLAIGRISISASSTVSLAGEAVASAGLWWRGFVRQGPPGSASWMPTFSILPRRSVACLSMRGLKRAIWSSQAGTAMGGAPGRWPGPLVAVPSFRKGRPNSLPAPAAGRSDPMSGFFLVRRAALNLDALQPRGFKILLEIVIRTSGSGFGGPVKLRRAPRGRDEGLVPRGSGLLAHLWHLRMGQLATRLGRFGVVGATGLAVNTALLALLVEPRGLNLCWPQSWRPKARRFGTSRD